MNKFYKFLFLLLLPVLSAHAQNAYITVWKTDNPGIVSNKSIMIPATGTNYRIEWQEDGNPSNKGTAVGSGHYILNLPSPGTYQ